MGFQIGGAILDFIVLSILHNQDQYGYSLTRQVREILDVSETSLYPALKRLQKLGYLEAYDKPFQGRMRKYYRISESGQEYYADTALQWKQFEAQVDQLLEGDVPCEY